MIKCVHSDVYLSLNDVTIPNHGYVKISDIGSTDSTALICNTNHPANYTNKAKRNHSGGDWYGLSKKVGGRGSYNVTGFGRTRDPMIVRLLRDTGTGSPPEGIYHCVVEDDTGTNHTLYVGLYNSGGGVYNYAY